jgi:hypothetical protein
MELSSHVKGWCTLSTLNSEMESYEEMIDIQTLRENNVTRHSRNLQHPTCRKAQLKLIEPNVLQGPAKTYSMQCITRPSYNL